MNNLQCSNHEVITMHLGWAVAMQLYDQMVSFNYIQEGEILGPGDWMKRLAKLNYDIGAGFETVERQDLIDQGKLTPTYQEHCK